MLCVNSKPAYASASPATGSLRIHLREQEEFVLQALHCRVREGRDEKEDVTSEKEQPHHG